MRIPKRLSYSAFALFEKDPTEYYIRYLAENRPERKAQDTAAAAGSAFDAYVKNGLYQACYGKLDPQFEIETIIEEQVEPQNRQWAFKAGQYLFDAYKQSGAYDDLLEVMKDSLEPPRFEFSVEGEIDANGTMVPFTGKPDCRFVTRFPAHVILDFKVNGFASKYDISPAKNYMLCRDGYKHRDGVKPSRSHNKQHKGFSPMEHRGLRINTSWMEQTSVDWANQLSLYGWLMDEQPGDEDVVLAVDQLVCKQVFDQIDDKKTRSEEPLIRVAQFRGRVSREHQLDLLGRIKSCWEAITSGHIFQDLSLQENYDLREQLEAQAAALKSDGSAEEDFFNECVRPAYRG